MVLTCEMCGASLDVNKAINDVVVCEYCDSATNIHGIVRLNMSSDDRAAALMKRGFVFLEYKVWDKARYVLTKAVNYDSNNAKAYLGLLMVETKSAKEEELSLHNKELATYKNYQRALEFADVGLKSRLESYNEKSKEVYRQEQIKKEEQKERIKQLRQEQISKAVEEEKAVRKRLKTQVLIGVLVLCVVAVLIIVGLRARELRLENERIALENLERLTELAFIIELVGQDPQQHISETKGLTAVTGQAGTYRVDLNLVDVAGFVEVSFQTGRIDFDEVNRFAGIDLEWPNRVTADLLERYGIEAEVYEHARVRTAGSIRESIIDGVDLDNIDSDNIDNVIWGAVIRSVMNTEEPCPQIIEISFVKNEIPVVIIMTTTYESEFGGTQWDSQTTWTVTVGE